MGPCLRSHSHLVRQRAPVITAGNTAPAGSLGIGRGAGDQERAHVEGTDGVQVCSLGYPIGLGEGQSAEPYMLVYNASAEFVVVHA